MSQKERVGASLEQITSLCFQISGSVVEEEEEKCDDCARLSLAGTLDG
jgi:hypothetical protein